MPLQDKNFRALVNAAGLPIHRISTPPNGKELPLPITPNILAQWYWLLGGIEIRYTYRLNNYTFNRSALLDSSAIKPSERSLNAPNFRFNSRDTQLRLQTNIYFGLHLANFTGTSICHIPIEFSEGDTLGNFLFTLKNPNTTPNLRLLHSYTATFLDVPLMFALYVKSPQYTGTILNVQILGTFFQIC